MECVFLHKWITEDLTVTSESCSPALESERLNHWTTEEVPHLVLDAMQSDRVHKVSLVLLSCHDSLNFYNCPVPGV